MITQSNPNNTSFLPNFCSTEVLFIVILSVESLAIILSLTLPLNVQNVLFELALNSLFIQWIALSCVGLLCLCRSYIATLSDQVAALISYSIILIVTIIITELAWWFLYFYPEPSILNGEMHLLFLFRSIGIAAIVGAIVLRYLYVQHQWRKNIEAVAATHYQAMQSRIRPHFLFNCMNTIASLTRKSPALAEQSIEDMADLFRLSLLETSTMYKITDEWNTCQTYLRIEEQRLGERLKVDWNIATLPKDALIPPLSLQPLLENAIYHGIERLTTGGVITIHGTLNEQSLYIQFINPIPTNDLDNLHKGNKIAQDNIRQRLAAVFGKKSCLEIDCRNDLYRVIVTVPYERYEDIDR